MKKKLIQFKNIVKSYEDGKVVLKGIDLDIYENEFVTLLGPSGCGKTTLLRILGGFLQADQGEVLFDGQEISKLPPYKREINTVWRNSRTEASLPCPVDSSSESPLRVRLSMSRACCFWMSLWVRLT